MKEMMSAEEAREWGKTLSFESVWATLQEVGRMHAENEKSIKEMSKSIKELSKNVSGVNRSLGRWAEEAVAPKLWEKFRALGYAFTKGGVNVKFWNSERILAQVDVFLENGEYVMAVEAKVDLTLEDVNEHLERIKTIRGYMDKRDDKRIIVGAVAGMIVPESIYRYAQKQGLYALVQSGEAIAVADLPADFTPRTWR